MRKEDAVTRVYGDEEMAVRFPVDGPLDVFASDPEEYPYIMRVKADQDGGVLYLVIISTVGYAALVWCIEHQRLYTINVSQPLQRAK